MNDSKFNIPAIKVKQVRQLMKDFDLVIVHGSGSVFRSNNHETTKVNEMVDGKYKIIEKPQALYDSDYHKEYNSGYDQNEAVSIASFRAIFRRGDKMPESPQDIIDEFYRQIDSEMRIRHTQRNDLRTNVIKIEDEAEELKQEASKIQDKLLVTEKIPETKLLDPVKPEVKQRKPQKPQTKKKKK